MIAALAGPGYGSEASDLYHKAQKLEKVGNVVQAYTLYAEAAALEPQNRTFRAKADSLRIEANVIQLRESAKKAKEEAAAKENDAAAKAAAAKPEGTAEEAGADPQVELSPVTDYELDKARRALPPPEVKLPSGRFDFHLNVSPQELFNEVAHRCGLETVFDGEYAVGATAGQKIRFDVEDVDCRAAIHAAEAATSSFVAPLSSKLILISKDTVQKRNANEQTMTAVVPLETALSQQDLTEISQAVKQVSGVDKVSWQAASNEIMLHDRVSRVKIAQEVIRQLTAYRAGVVFDLRFLQLSDQDMQQYGVNLTNTFNVTWLGNQTAASAGTTLQNLFSLIAKGGKLFNTFGITALEGSVVAQLTQSASRTVLQTHLRTVNGLPSTLHVGEKYPVLTAGYFGGTPTTNNSGAYTPPASFSYFDLGTSVKILPMVGNSDLITLDIETEYQLLAGQSLDGIPIMASRNMATRISIHNGEWALIGGLMDSTDNKTVSGVAGLARIPILGWLFKTQTREKNRDHIVIVMKPELVGEPPASRETAPLPVGTETRPLSLL